MLSVMQNQATNKTDCPCISFESIKKAEGYYKTNKTDCPCISFESIKKAAGNYTTIS